MDLLLAAPIQNTENAFATQMEPEKIFLPFYLLAPLLNHLGKIYAKRESSSAPGLLFLAGNQWSSSLSICFVTRCVSLHEMGRIAPKKMHNTLTPLCSHHPLWA